MSNPESYIRYAEGDDDAAQLLQLIESLAVFEKLAAPDDAARTRFIRDGFHRDPPRFTALLGGITGEPPCAYAIFFETYSTFLCRPTLYVEDVFVRPTHRGIGIGRALMRRLAAIAHERGCGRMEWTCLDWNVNAQAFYARLGASRLDEWYSYRMDAAMIEQLRDRD